MPVGEGRGVTELREPTMSNSPNVAAKMAQKGEPTSMLYSELPA